MRIVIGNSNGKTSSIRHRNIGRNSETPIMSCLLATPLQPPCYGMFYSSMYFAFYLSFESVTAAKRVCNGSIMELNIFPFQAGFLLTHVLIKTYWVVYTHVFIIQITKHTLMLLTHSFIAPLVGFRPYKFQILFPVSLHAAVRQSHYIRPSWNNCRLVNIYMKNEAKLRK
jgi:hypothetical protein